MKNFLITFYDTRLKIDRQKTYYHISLKDCESSFIFSNPDYLILDIKEIE
jgi:hypothetical protein